MTGKIDNSTIMLNFNTPLKIMEKKTRHKVSKERKDLNINKLKLTAIYRTVHPTRAGYAYFSILMEHSTE